MDMIILGFQEWRRKGGAMLVILLVMLLLAACAHVPVTGRNQLSLVSSQELIPQSEKAYREFLGKHKLCRDPDKVAMVKRVGNRIARAVEQYLAQNGKQDLIKGYNWEFNLVEDKQKNAWCMPGGKVVVYTGLLPICRDETGLAVVLGHEIAHAVANHAGERISQSMLLQMGGVALAAVVGSQTSISPRAVLDLYGLGANVGVMLPYSRMQELEADKLGLIFMAMAGYDPRKALDFWQRMDVAAKKAGRPPEFLSTHPSSVTRMQKIKEFIPEAMRYYHPQNSRW